MMVSLLERARKALAEKEARMQGMVTPDMLTRPQAAKHLGHAVRWLDQLRAEKRGPKFKMVNRRMYYTIADLDRWKADGEAAKEALRREMDGGVNG